MSERLENALLLARHGIAVFPAFTVRPNGTCGCRDGADCASPGKHPLHKGWQAQATTDPEEIRGIWERMPRANVGVATGAGSGIFELDIDPRHGGDETLAALERKHGRLPETVEILTGGGGRGLLFVHPGFRVATRAKLAPGLDIRGDGGLFIGPGSDHASGKRYEWEASSVLGEVPIASAPEWLLAMLRPAEDASPCAKRANSEEGTPARIVPLIEGCAWLRHTCEDAAQLGEGPWYAMLSIVGRCEDGAEIAHAFSRPHPGYRPELTQKKLEHAVQDAGPATCQRIRELDGEEYCRTCVHRGRIKSPIALARGRVADLPVPPPSRMQIEDVSTAPVPELPDEVKRTFFRGARPGAGNWRQRG